MRKIKNVSNTGIPILYYHSIANHEKKNNWSFLSISIELFKKQISYLSKKGYYACDWKELEDHINGLKKLPKKTVMFHFDDGFLDNWSVVFPIMKEAGFKYSIVLTPEFIQKGSEKRPFVSKTRLSNQKDWWGYLNEAEIKYMADSGLVDFQAHGYTHTWYEISNELVDIYDGNNFYPHILWNNNPDQKPYWLTEHLKVIKGYPIFKYKKSLEMDKRFLLNPKMIEELVLAYDENISREDNLSNYNQIINRYKQTGETGEYETQSAKDERLKMELYQTRIELESVIRKAVEYIVFPGGGNSPEVVDLCKQYGYKLISKGTQLNAFNSNIYQVIRYSGVYNFPVLNITLNMLFLRFQLLRGQGNPWINRLSQLFRK